MHTPLMSIMPFSNYKWAHDHGDAFQQFDDVDLKLEFSYGFKWGVTQSKGKISVKSYAIHKQQR